MTRYNIVSSKHKRRQKSFYGVPCFQGIEQIINLSQVLKNNSLVLEVTEQKNFVWEIYASI